MNSRGRRTQRRAQLRTEERLARKRVRPELTQMIVPEHIKALTELVSGR